MATLDKALFSEGQSIVRPPMFCGEYFDLWRLRIETFLKSIDMRLWFIVKNGPYEALIEDNITRDMRPKTMDELTSHDMDKMCLDNKTIEQNLSKRLDYKRKDHQVGEAERSIEAGEIVVGLKDRVDRDHRHESSDRAMRI